jgi:hypothetical protein
MFNEFFRPLGISKQMAVALPSDSVGIPVLALARSKFDYTTEAKSVLRALIPKIRGQIAAEQTWGHYDLLIKQLIGVELPRRAHHISRVCGPFSSPDLRSSRSIFSRQRPKSQSIAAGAFAAATFSVGHVLFSVHVQLAGRLAVFPDHHGL